MDNTTKRLTPEPLVSIWMLTYNREKYIREAIESVLSQTYENFELIIIDNGSTDGTQSIIDSFGDSRINYIKHQENTGLERRREFEVQTAGKYIAVLDSDDAWSSAEKLKKQVEFLDANENVGVVGTFITLIDSEGRKIGETKYNIADKQIRNSILTRNQFTHSSVLIRKSILKKTTGYKVTLAEDLELFLQIGNFSEFANIPEFLTKYRVHEGTLNDRGIKMARALHKIIKDHKNEYPKFLLAILKNYLRLTVGYVKLFLKI